MKHSSMLAYGVAEPSSSVNPIVNDLLIVEDHPVMSEALALILQIEFGLRSVRTEQSRETAAEAVRNGPLPDAILLDLHLPDCSGIETLIALRKIAPETPIVVISADRCPTMVSAALAAGARGYIGKELIRKELCANLNRAFCGEIVVPDWYDPGHVDPAEQQKRSEAAERLMELTPQQLRILRLICAGHANKEIAYQLSIAEATVKTHVNKILKKINVRRRTQAVRLANEVQLFTFAELG